MVRLVKTGKPSSTAQHIALARAYLTRLGVIDDPIAERMLRSPWREANRLTRRRPFDRVGRTRMAALVGARTLFFDEAVTTAMDAGIRQVVVIAAGYDSRAWRLARPGVRFFEVDHPATQTDKRARAPQGGPAFVPADLPADRLVDVLPAAGFVIGEPAVFTVEGLTQYLTEAAVAELAATLASLAGAGGRLAVNFGYSYSRARPGWSRALAGAWRVGVAATGESFRYSPTPQQAAELLERSGWSPSRTLTGAEAGRRYLATTPFRAMTPNDEACLIEAVAAPK